MKRTNFFKRGVTLVEIAIVLVIIGLLLGGILKGQELINNAKVRAIADRQNSLKVAWFAFIDRYQALPGDYVRARQNVPGAGEAVTLGTGGEGAGDGIIIESESPIVMQHLTGAGYLRCPQCTYETNAITLPDATNSLQNQYGGVMAIFVDGFATATDADAKAGGNQSYAFVSGSGNRTPRLMAHTGPNIPSNIISEVDRKIDDGSPQHGDVRASHYAATGIAPGAGCMDLDPTNTAQDDSDALYTNADADTSWRYADSPPEANCGAAVII